MQLRKLPLIFLFLAMTIISVANVVQGAGPKIKPRLPNQQQIGLRIKGHGVNRHILPMNNGQHIEL